MRAGRGQRGSAEVFAVLLLLAVVGAALTFYYAAREDARRVAVARQTGALFASWFLAAHRASQTEAAAYRVALGGGPFSLSPGQLRALGVTAVGLRDVVGREAVLRVGIIADGTPRGVPMAFGVLEPVDADGVALREGALDAGLAFVAVGAGAGTPVAAHVGAIEVAIGRPVAVDALLVTGDVGVRYRERVLYRRAQPGRAYLSRMETALDVGTNDLLSSGGFGGALANVSGDVTVAGVASDVVAVDVLGRVSVDRFSALADVSNIRDVEAAEMLVLAQLDVGPGSEWGGDGGDGARARCGPCGRRGRFAGGRVDWCGSCGGARGCGGECRAQWRAGVRAGVGGNGNRAGGGGVDGVEHGWSERPGEWRGDGRVVLGLRVDALKRR